MLSSIHPLGERARNNRWSVTAGSFTIASTLVGSLIGAGLAWLGSVTLGSVDDSILLLGTAILAIGAAVLDVARVRPRARTVRSTKPGSATTGAGSTVGRSGPSWARAW